MSSQSITIEKQMGITHAEFMRLLPRALGTSAFEMQGAVIVVPTDGGKQLSIALGPESIRQIALMRMPTMPVTLIFSGYTQAEAEDALSSFDRAYQRGGG